MTTTHVTTLPLSQLRLDPVNVRKVSKGADPEFVASIKHHGVELPLAVRPNGGDEHLVTDGGKRLAALQALAKAGDIPADFPVPVVVKQRTDAEARETSLTLNVIRSAMHPVDEYRALAELHVDKSQPLDIDAIAIRFGWPRKQVEQRLALGALDAKILDAWRKGDINADTVKAFTLCPEKKAQARLFDKLARERNLSPWRVKAELTAGQDDVGRLLGIVGAENYAARGGKIVEDLFGTDHIVSDHALLKAMVGEKIEAECQRLVAEGWKFAIPIPEQSYLFGHLIAKNKPDQKQNAKLGALRKQIERLQDSDEPEAEATCEAACAQYHALEAELRADAFTAKQKATAGCLIGLAHDGGLRIDYGRTQPAERSKVVREQERGSAAKKAVGTISNALKIRLDVQRTKALVKALTGDNHGNALGDLLAKIVASLITPERPYATHVESSHQDALRKTITAKVMNQALRDCFDATDYFGSAPKALCLAAIRDAVNPDEARKLASKSKGEIAKFAIANVAKSKWLPVELRTVHYDGPTAKTTKAKRK